MKLIHYGCTQFNPDKFQPVMNRIGWNKGTGGLWTSPDDSNYGWRDWCKDEDFRECNENDSIILELKGSARILVIDSALDMDKLIFSSEERFGSTKYPITTLDFESMSKDYDAIHLTQEGEWATRLLGVDANLYGWDCESVFIMNKEAIQ